MRARAALTVELDAGGRSVVRELRSQAPLSLVPRRGTAAARADAVTVHVVGSACTPLAGDEVELDVQVGPGASLVLTGVAAAVALPGAGRSSSAHLRFTVGAGAGLQYLPEPTVVTARADHRTSLDVELHPTARLRIREILVAGRTGEPSGRYRGSVRITELTGAEEPTESAGFRPSAPTRVLLAQTQELGDPVLQASPAHLAGRRVLASEVLVWGEDPREAVSGAWWSLVPLARRGSLATAVGPDAVIAQRELARAVAAHPGWSAEVLGEVPAEPPRAGDSCPASPGLPSRESGCGTRRVADSPPEEPAHGRVTSPPSEAR